MEQTVLHAWHQQHGGRMVDFAGWEMPIQYTTIVEEHHAVRQRVGLFDIAHMGRVMFSGPDAEIFVDRLTTNAVPLIKPGQVRYSLICHEQGGILDDVLIYRFEQDIMLVVNASNRIKILNWIEQHRGGFAVEVHDRTTEWFMLALQGPAAEQVLQPHCDQPLSRLRYYQVAELPVAGVRGIVSRTGYTGEDGFEVIVPVAEGLRIWQSLYDAGQSHGLLPCGLGCRDTLRLEAGMPLYGHEMDEQTDPFTAGLAFGVKLDQGEFFGRRALLAARDRTDRPQRIGLQLEGKRIAREGAQIYHDETLVGRVTSGTYSPTLERPIAMGYVPSQLAAVGTKLLVDIRGQRLPAEVVKLPFYSRPRSS